MRAPTRSDASGPAPGRAHEPQLWRERTLRAVTLACLGTCAGIIVWYVVVDRRGAELLPALLGSMLVLAAVAWWRRAPFALRSAALLGALYLPSAFALKISGFAPNPFVALATMCVVATLLLGRRLGLALVLVSSLTVGLIAWLHRKHLLERRPDWMLLLDSTKPAASWRVLVVFTLLTTTLVLSVSYLLNRSEQLSSERAESLEKLRSEQLERGRIAQDLEFKEAAFHKARELELLGRLAGSMAHDFNNALLVIWAALDELSLLPDVPSAAGEALAALRIAADQAAATTRQLRAFGPLGPQKPVELALTPLLEKARVMFSRVLPQNIELRAEIAVEAWLTADEGELLRVLMNLALNARDAMRDGGRLTLRVRLPTARERKALARGQSPTPAEPGVPESVGEVVLEVADTGAGMTDAVKARVFEPFFTTKDALGTGLGLASVRDMVVKYGGRVEVASTLGVGTTVSLFLPSAIPARAPVSAAPALAGERTAVVLLVDDDPAVRTALSRGMRRAGITVLECADGAAALVLARRQARPIDVLVTDCVMPGLPIGKLITEFRKLHPGHVLVCSGYAPAETGLTPEIFDDFLPKPFGSEALVARVYALVLREADRAPP